VKKSFWQPSSRLVPPAPDIDNGRLCRSATSGARSPNQPTSKPLFISWISYAFLIRIVTLCMNRLQFPSFHPDASLGLYQPFGEMIASASFGPQLPRL
jgi:hypothetical protein